MVQTVQKLSEEAPGGVSIAPGLNEDVEHDTVLIDGAPKVMPHPLDVDEDLVEIPLVSWPWPAAQAAGNTRGEFLATASHGLEGNDNSAD
jgi:hypothetical protein